MAMVALRPAQPLSRLRYLAVASKPVTLLCDNSKLDACNWTVNADREGGHCRSCALNHTIPTLDKTENQDAWRMFERSKKRLVYSLIRFGLPFDAKSRARIPFRTSLLENAMTGHSEGHVTISVDETDSVERERQRQDLNEPYRTLLGHLRHESGHYYWELLINDTPKLLAKFREIFGDERADYDEALNRHYSDGPPQNWRESSISAYGSMHPWEDWAETWAHYFHMVDLIDTATNARFLRSKRASLKNPYREQSFDVLFHAWVELTLALNELSRSMGHEDFYPFVLASPARDKLLFVHRTVHGVAKAGR